MKKKPAASKEGTDSPKTGSSQYRYQQPYCFGDVCSEISMLFTLLACWVARPPDTTPHAKSVNNIRRFHCLWGKQSLMNRCPFFLGLEYMQKFFPIWRSPVPEIEISQQPAAKLVGPRIQQTPSVKSVPSGKRQQPTDQLAIQQQAAVKLSKEGTDCQITPGYNIKSHLLWSLFDSLSLFCGQQTPSVKLVPPEKSQQPGAMLETPANKQDEIVPQPVAKLSDKHDAPTIGMILCQAKDRIFAEYALRDIHKPIGVADYELTHALPKEFASSLPSIEDIETELTETLKEQAE